MGIKPQQITHFFLAVFLGVIALIALNYAGFYVREFGTSSSAALWTMAKQESALTISYTYDTFAAVLKVPRSTIPGLPWHFAILAAIISGLVLLFIAVLIAKIRRIRHNARAKVFVFIAIGILFVKDAALGLGCKAFYCNTILTSKVNLAADLLMIIALVVLFVELVMPRTAVLKGKKKEKKDLDKY